MIKLRIEELLEEKKRSKYWLYKQMNLSYQNLSKMMNNETTSIKFDNIERLCKILDCEPNDLFEITDNNCKEKTSHMP